VLRAAAARVIAHPGSPLHVRKRIVVSFGVTGSQEPVFYLLRRGYKKSVLLSLNASRFNGF
jgi:hypothetical protein